MCCAVLLWLSDRSGYHVSGAEGIISSYYRSQHLVRKLRLLTILVTLLTLPGYGLAGLTHVRSCQAQMRASDHVVMLGDCCPGEADQSTPCKRFGDGPGKNGTCTPCKAGYNCKSPQSYEPTQLVAMLVTPTRPVLTANPPTLIVSHSSNGLWRPPRFI
jgi:hypothetical protein